MVRTFGLPNLPTVCRSIESSDTTLTKINAVDVQQPQTLSASLLAVLVRAVDLEAFTALDKAEFGGQKDFAAASGALEPAADELFGVAVQTGIYTSSA